MVVDCVYVSTEMNRNGLGGSKSLCIKEIGKYESVYTNMSTDRGKGKING